MSNMYSFKKMYDELIAESANPSYKYVFSANIAAEFTKTVNEFTTICAKMVEMKKIDEDTIKEFDETFSRIKNLIDASKI